MYERLLKDSPQYKEILSKQMQAHEEKTGASADLIQEKILAAEQLEFDSNRYQTSLTQANVSNYELEQTLSAELIKATAARVEQAKTARLHLLGISLLLLVVIAGLSWYMIQIMIRQIGNEPLNVAHFASEVAQGNLSASIQLSDDDTTSIAAALMVMVDNIRSRSWMQKNRQ